MVFCISHVQGLHTPILSVIQTDLNSSIFFHHLLLLKFLDKKGTWAVGTLTINSKSIYYALLLNRVIEPIYEDFLEEEQWTGGTQNLKSNF